MTSIRIANAPCSWGNLEFEGLGGQPLTCERMLDELVETGYTGTELGDWGFMPTEPTALRTILEQRGVTMVGAFVPVRFIDATAHAAGAEAAVKVARLLAVAASPDHAPMIILADENGTVAQRTANAGRVTSAMGLDNDGWRVFSQGVEAVARAVQEATGLPVGFHHHCAGYVETPAEIETLLKHTSTELLGLVFDTGHYAFGAGDRDGSLTRTGLERFASRITHMHYKDCEPGVAERSAAEGWDYFQSVGQGVFCELGKGCVDFAWTTQWLRESKYKGFITVEQDVLPGMGAPKESARRNREYLKTLGL
jgi:inosose dehydratase